MSEPRGRLARRRETRARSTVKLKKGRAVSIKDPRLRRAVRQLPLLERRTLEQLYGIGRRRQSVRQVARRLRMTNRDVGLLEERALARLRRELCIPEEA